MKRNFSLCALFVLFAFKVICTFLIPHASSLLVFYLSMRSFAIILMNATEHGMVSLYVYVVVFVLLLLATIVFALLGIRYIRLRIVSSASVIAMMLIDCVIQVVFSSEIIKLISICTFCVFSALFVQCVWDAVAITKNKFQ